METSFLLEEGHLLLERHPFHDLTFQGLLISQQFIVQKHLLMLVDAQMVAAELLDQGLLVNTLLEVFSWRFDAVAFVAVVEIGLIVGDLRIDVEKVRIEII